MAASRCAGQRRRAGDEAQQVSNAYKGGRGCRGVRSAPRNRLPGHAKQPVLRGRTARFALQTSRRRNALRARHLQEMRSEVKRFDKTILARRAKYESRIVDYEL